MTDYPEAVIVFFFSFLFVDFWLDDLILPFFIIHPLQLSYNNDSIVETQVIYNSFKWVNR